ncbi:hypothetical protein BLNAU_7852 [Blattamonas nauphoetae]|uniref:Uncharacterized protein n=1 Tax=Blattamonas nauphoetae TaxID=2049346 RepID=A0ABQ9Y0J5_9EUKA|nr:hypothetical protein BLNAU_7852 [Blattamonas nauphoetae]
MKDKHHQAKQAKRADICTDAPLIQRKPSQTISHAILSVVQAPSIDILTSSRSKERMANTTSASIGWNLEIKSWENAHLHQEERYTIGSHRDPDIQWTLAVLGVHYFITFLKKFNKCSTYLADQGHGLSDREWRPAAVVELVKTLVGPPLPNPITSSPVHHWSRACSHFQWLSQSSDSVVDWSDIYVKDENSIGISVNAFRVAATGQPFTAVLGIINYTPVSPTTVSSPMMHSFLSRHQSHPQYSSNESKTPPPNSKKDIRFGSLFNQSVGYRSSQTHIVFSIDAQLFTGAGAEQPRLMETQLDPFGLTEKAVVGPVTREEAITELVLTLIVDHDVSLRKVVNLSLSTQRFAQPHLSGSISSIKPSAPGSGSSATRGTCTVERTVILSPLEETRCDIA